MEGKGLEAGVAFLEERRQQIEHLIAEHKKADIKEPETSRREWNQLRALIREYSHEIERCGASRRQMRRRAVALLDKLGRLSLIERIEVTGLLRVFAAEAIRHKGDTTKNSQAFMNEWDVHHRGISVKVTALSAWWLARDDEPGAL